MIKRLKLVASSAIFAAALSSAASARDLDKSDPERAHILAAVHRLNANDSELNDYRYYVVDLVKDHNTAFICVALTDKDGNLEMTDDQAEIMRFALEKRDTQWMTVDLSGVGFAAGAKPVQSDCLVDGRLANTRADIDAALKATGHKPFATR